jgi:hypothetical protein
VTAPASPPATIDNATLATRIRPRRAVVRAGETVTPA